MKTIYQIATGSSVREEITDYAVENNHNAIEAALKELLSVDYSYLGTYVSYELGTPDDYGNIPLKVNYIDDFDDEEYSEWELRPVKFYR